MRPRNAPRIVLVYVTFRLVQRPFTVAWSPMEFDALDALALDAVRFTSARGERRLAAVVKVTFALVDGGDARLAEPLALFDDVPFEDNDERSLWLASD